MVIKIKNNSDVFARCGLFGFGHLKKDKGLIDSLFNYRTFDCVDVDIDWEGFPEFNLDYSKEIASFEVSKVELSSNLKKSLQMHYILTADANGQKVASPIS